MEQQQQQGRGEQREDEGGATMLQFEGWSSSVDATFWHELSRRKLEQFKLSEAPVALRAHYATGGASSHPLPARLFLEAASFDGASPRHASSTFRFNAPGQLLNTNTIEAFGALDKKKQLEMAAAQVWHDIDTGAALQNPWLLCRFLMLAFSDLKRYRFHYMVAFPALLPLRPFFARQPVLLAEALAPSEIQSLREGYEALRRVDDVSRVASSQAGQTPPIDQPTATASHTHDKDEEVNGGLWHHPFFIAKRETGNISAIRVAPLHAYQQFWHDVPHENRLVGFADPSSRRKNPGWPLRNFLVLLTRWVCRGMTSVPVICYREIPGKQNIEASLLLEVALPTETESIIDESNLKVAGWEKDSEGKLRPRIISLATSMDPQRLADTAVELNLQLMRWRLLPSLDLERVAATRCLLLGAGTLGCNVARSLLGWGVRHITLVDNGLVSYSNPVRQSLFTFEDSLNGGLPKAAAAANRLRQIFPGVNAAGHRFSIPMPGHAIAETQHKQVEQDYEHLRGLIETHDVVFLLTDSRESRWLPTLIAASLDKLVINAALGFDSYVVMRHGVWDRSSEPSKDVHLGCYFCNDVVAPQDSLSDRTLDQQCTVTRPGVSYLAGSIAVELLVSLLHHPLGSCASADVEKDVSESTESPLGLIPHQIRGYLSHFKNLLVVGHAYDKCIACSRTVVRLYQQHGFEFLLRVFNNPTHLEDVTGLTELKQSTVDFSLDWEQFEEDPEN